MGQPDRSAQQTSPIYNRTERFPSCDGRSGTRETWEAVRETGQIVYNDFTTRFETSCSPP